MAHSGLETDENDNSPQPIATLSSNSLFLWFSTSTIVALMEEIVGLTIYESQNTSDTKQSSTVRVLNCSAVKEHIISCLKLPLFWFKAKAYLFCPQFLKSGIEGGSRGQRKKITSGVSLTPQLPRLPKAEFHLGGFSLHLCWNVLQHWLSKACVKWMKKNPLFLMIKWHSLHAKWIQNLISIVCNTLCELKKKYSEFQRDQNMSSQLNCIFILFVWIACTSFHSKYWLKQRWEWTCVNTYPQKIMGLDIPQSMKKHGELRN